MQNRLIEKSGGRNGPNRVLMDFRSASPTRTAQWFLVVQQGTEDPDCVLLNDRMIHLEMNHP